MSWHLSTYTSGHFSLPLIICAVVFMIDIVWGILHGSRFTGKGFGYWCLSLLFLIIAGVGVIGFAT